MQEVKKYKIGNSEYQLRQMEVVHYRKVYAFISKNNLKKYYSVVDNKFKIEVGELVQHLVLSNLLDRFLEMILEPVAVSKIQNAKFKIQKLFGVNPYKYISDVVLVEVLADFFSGKVLLWKGLMDAFIPFWKNINLPLNQLDQFQV